MTSMREVKKEVGGLMALAGPVVATQLANMALSTTDVLMAGRIGANDLAAIAVGSALANPMIYSLMGVLLAVTPIVAQLFGGNYIDQIGEKVRQGLWASLVVSIPGVALFYLLVPVMTLMNIDPAVIVLSKGYLAALSYGFPFFMAFFVLRFFNDGIGLTRPALYVSLVAIPVNAAANYVLMYGHFGFPRLGAVGTGWATAIVWLVMFLCLLAWIMIRPEYKAYDLWHFSKPSGKDLAEIFSIGLPSGANIFLEISMFATITLMIGSLGATAVASHQIAINVAGSTFMIPLGVSIALTARVGQTIGRGTLADARLAGQVGMGVCAVIGCGTSLIMIFANVALVRLYTPDQAIVELASGLLFYAAIFQLSDAIQVACVGALRGLKDTKIPMFFNMIAYWGVGLPLGWVMGFHRGMGTPGFWVGLCGGLTVSAVLNFMRWRYVSLGRNR